MNNNSPKIDKEKSIKFEIKKYLDFITLKSKLHQRNLFIPFRVANAADVNPEEINFNPINKKSSNIIDPCTLASANPNKIFPVKT